MSYKYSDCNEISLQLQCTSMTSTEHRYNIDLSLPLLIIDLAPPSVSMAQGVESRIAVLLKQKQHSDDPYEKVRLE